MIHIVFEADNVEVLSKAFELDSSMMGDIIEIKDDFAVGPIVDIYDTYGYQLRRDWWKELLEFTPYKEQLDLVDDKLTVFNLLKRLDKIPNDIEEGKIAGNKGENLLSQEDKQDQPANIQEDEVIDNLDNKEDIIVEEGVLYISDDILEDRNITSGSEESNATIKEIQEDTAKIEEVELHQDTVTIDSETMVTVSESLEALPENTEIVPITPNGIKSSKKATRAYKKEAKKHKEAIKEDQSETPHLEDVWIWMGQNQHDVCGYYWLMPQLKNYQGRIHVLYLNNLPFINEKGNIFYPTHLHQIQPKEFLKAKKLSRPITLSEFEIDPDEWKKLCSESAIVRILEGGKKIASKEDSFYDKDLLSVITPTFQKVSKVLFTSLGKMKIQTGDVFLAWRLRELSQEGKIEVQGEWSKGWKEVAVKLPSDNLGTTD